MYYVIQENTFREENYNVLVDTLDRFKIPYEIVKVKPFIEDFDFVTDRKDVFIFGSVKMARLSKKYGWYPGSMANDNHDYKVYSQYYRENLLNWDSKIQRFGDPIIVEEEDFFVRPTKDTKVFTGKVFNQTEWLEFKNRSLTDGHTTTLCDDTEIQVCSAKKIQKEFRFWIVDGKVVTYSQYKLGDWANYKGVVDDDAIEFCKEMVKIYCIAEAFVIDVCLIDDQYKIVECNCINFAGFYDANMPKLIDALEEKFTDRL